MTEVSLSRSTSTRFQPHLSPAWSRVDWTVAWTVMMMDSDSDNHQFQENSVCNDKNDQLSLQTSCQLFEEFNKEVICWDLVCGLVSMYPSICRKKDNDDMLPFCHACQWNVPLHVIQLLVNTWPHCVYDKGWFPLHLAYYSNAPLEVLPISCW